MNGDAAPGGSVPVSGGGVASGDGAGEPARELLSTAVTAARLAGGLLLERFERGVQRGVTSKSTPTDLVSEADLASERAIRELLAERRPHDGFIGEEGDAQSGSSGLRWIVDPLDGTVNFLFGIPQWCVSVAVADERGALAGVVYDPCRDELFTAARGAPPALSSASGTRALSGPRRAPERDGLSNAMVATGFFYDARVRAVQAQTLTRLLPLVRDIRRFGSAALDLAWTAAGRYDAYFERGVKEWDVAAGLQLCAGVGLQVRELPAHEDVPQGVLVAAPELCEALLGLIG